MIYTLEQAQSNLAQLLDDALAGKEVLIIREGKPMVRLIVREIPEFNTSTKP